ncbi:TetR family transcriptional regulator [Solirubrobacter soli]|uniref:TetR family transcriptional regulator n=1 Tax=Solirubrobacter soli TaxID=363832 RepID=UPI00040E4F92|nr:TetR/AcrR family transcriptional regulator [Solirubrobacter soli]
MTGLRERKKAATRIAIRDAGMRLFAERGFAGTTIDEIAEDAGVSRATVFAYFPTKEEIVFGDAAVAVDALRELLRDAPTIVAVRAWLKQLTGWLEPELLLQQRLREEAPTVAARRLQLLGAIEDVITEALKLELGPGRELAAQLTAAGLIGGLNAVELTAAAQMGERGVALSPAEIDHILDVTITYVEAGLAAVTGLSSTM